MKTNLTELVFILDRSGSMGGLESDTIGGFNSMLQKQQLETGECRISTILFDDKYELIHDRIEIKAVRQITDKEYFSTWFRTLRTMRILVHGFELYRQLIK